MSSDEHGTFCLRPMEAGRVLIAAIQRFYSQDILVDVKITSQNTTVLTCHKTILAAFSTYFEGLLISTEGPAILSLDSVSSEHIKQLEHILRFMYGFAVNVPKSDIHKLLESANLFGVNALIKILQPMVKLNQDNYSIQQMGIGPLLLVTFQRFKIQNKFVDARICISEEEHFSCHKIILASFSSYFESLLLTTEACAVMGLESVDPLYVRQLEFIMDYMYGRPVKLNDRQVDTLCEAAKVFGIHSLESGELTKIREKAMKYRQNKLLDKAAQQGNIVVAKQQKKAPKSKKSIKYAETLRKAWNNHQSSVSVRSNANSVTPPSFINLHTVNKNNLNNSTGKMTVKIVKITPEPSNSNNTPNLVPLSALHNSDHSSYIANFEDLPASTSHFYVEPVNVSLIEDNPAYDVPFLDALCNFDVPPSNSLMTSVDEHSMSELNCCTHPQFSPMNSPPPMSPNNTRDNNNILMVEVDSSNNSSPKLVKLDRTDSKNKETERPAKYLCKTCGKLFAHKNDLTSHIENEHQQAINAGDDLSSDSEINEDLNDGESIVKETFKPPQNITKRKNKSLRVRPTTCPHCEFNSNSGQVFEHVVETHAQNSTFNHVCDYCYQLFTTRHKLMNHLTNQHKVKLLSCGMCDKMFTSFSGLRNHMQTHSGLLFLCKFCDYTATTKQNLRVHETGAHAYNSGQGKTVTVHSCPQCDATFPYKSLLQRHISNKHEKSRPYECPKCEHRSSTKHALKTHITCVHTNAFPFKCSSCTESFKTSSLLARHNRANHEICEDKRKPHVCHKCGIRYAEKRSLTVHENANHRRIKPFACETCGVPFTRKDNMYAHMRKVHGKYVQNDLQDLQEGE